MAGKQVVKRIGFENIQIFKDQSLGVGSYGKVYRAKCDDLLCAAKLIHETLFDPTAQQLVACQREHRLPMRRFEQECEFLSTIRHPNIVQYLGIYQDTDTGLPALLMELMDDSLTHFLENSPQLIPYHIQVNFCHDITVALSFLHCNGIIHRDLSSNNVLLIGNVRAKVTDFGMAKLDDQNPQATQLAFTMCPGTDVYMPPEAVQEEPVYTEKIDCFSFGVIAVQILSRQFPKPSNRKKRIPINLPGLPSNTMAEVPIPEIERRQNHISTIDPNDTLLKVALDCLKDRDVERPSAQQICERVVALKEDPRYSESVKVVEARSSAEQGRSDGRDRELRSLRQQHSQQVQELQQIIQSQTNRLEEKNQTIAENEQVLVYNQETIAELKREKKQLEMASNQIIEGKNRELGHVYQQLKKSQHALAQLSRQVTEIDQLTNTESETSKDSNKHDQLKPGAGMESKSELQKSGDWIKMAWREEEKAPCEMGNASNAVVDAGTVYVRVEKHMYSYCSNTSTWSKLPDSPLYNCPSVIINNLLTLVGGFDRSDTLTNQLFSLTGEGSGRRWTEEFPPMPTKRRGSTALCTGTALVVAGGRKNDLFVIQTVEVLNTETLQWSTAADLPQPLSSASAAVCGDRVYILAESCVYTCSIITLIQTHKSYLASMRNRGTVLWKEVAVPPVKHTTCVSIHGRLLAVGGVDSYYKSTTAIHMYNPVTDSWEVVSHMGTPRCLCVAAVLPNNQLMVVGSWAESTVYLESTDIVEVATTELVC